MIKKNHVHHLIIEIKVQTISESQILYINRKSKIVNPKS